jgi:EAL and modified HD-GYP domain-containing signal transduction protein
MAEENVFIARQPIMDRNGSIYGYELLFRESSLKNFAEIIDDLAATSQVLISTLTTFGARKLLGSSYGFININEAVVEKGFLNSLKGEKFIFEILESTLISPEFISQISEMRDKGFLFALDDFIFKDQFIEYFRPLFDYISVVKVDLLQNDPFIIKKKMDIFTPYKIKLLAEKVEDMEQFDYCKQLGFELFQGYYFAKPVILSGKKISPDQLAIVELIKLLKSNADIHVVETVFKKYPEMTINLLKFINSAAFGTRSKITSVRQAIALLGMNNLMHWLILLSYAGSGGDRNKNPLFKTAGQRAKAMELFLKNTMGEKNRQILDEGFLVGLLSLMDALFQTSLNEIIKELNLNEEINNALMNHEGTLGKLLSLIEETEKYEVNLKKVSDILESMNATMQDWTNNYFESVAWIEDMPLSD